MGNTLNGEELLPAQASLTLCHVEKVDDHNWMVNTIAGPEAAKCPDCGVLSTSRHSSYLRHLSNATLNATGGDVFQIKCD